MTGQLRLSLDATPPAVAVLFARADSNYLAIPGADVWDMARDARRWPGGMPVVAHPPCRAWGRLRKLAKPRADEKALALAAVDNVRQFGGVLEHPECSSLWPAAGLPRPGESADAFGGWTLAVDQFRFGHRAEKRTWLYIVGCAPADIPPLPPRVGRPSHVICMNRNRGGARVVVKGHPLWRPEVSVAEREHSPPRFAAWLVELARRCAK